jgi:hypothetical protein
MFKLSDAMNPLLVPQTVGWKEEKDALFLPVPRKEGNARRTGQEAHLRSPPWARSKPQAYKIPYEVHSAKRKSRAGNTANIPGNDRGMQSANLFDIIVERLGDFVEDPPHQPKILARRRLGLVNGNACRIDVLQLPSADCTAHESLWHIDCSSTWPATVDSRFTRNPMDRRIEK